MTPDQLALLADTRLPTPARIIGLLISEHPEGWEVSKEQLAGFMGPSEGASDDTIGRHLKRLEVAGWVSREPGGRGHPDRFRILAPHECGGNGALRAAFVSQVNLTYRPGAALNTLSTGPGAALSRPSSSSTEPPPPPLDARARDFIDRTECLVGCRGSLTDYLTERVSAEHHLAYAQTVAGMIEGTDERVWMARDGTHVRAGRQQIVAGCLNELRQGDEVGRYFPAAPGNVRNLQSKIRYRVKAETDAKRDAERRSESPGAPGAARAQPRARAASTPEPRVER